VSDPFASLRRFGFDSFFEQAFVSSRTGAGLDLVPGRVALEHRSGYSLLTDRGERPADLAGRLRHAITTREQSPAVGDWVAFRASDDDTHASIHAVLPRRTSFVRAEAGGVTEAQVVAANVDVVFLVCALGHDLKVRRLERYLALARSSGADPVVVLTKADLCEDADDRRCAIESTANAPVHVVSSVTGEGFAQLRAYFANDRTIALLGSSGAGKSTLVNRLLGEEHLAVNELGVDGRGRHTTTHRELVVLSTGGMVIDTPGMRELRLWDADDGLDQTFADIAAIAVRCRFRDCTHAREPGCAVQASLEEGTLEEGRWSSYLKLERENAAFARRKDARAAREEKRRIKVFARSVRTRPNRGE